MNNGKKFRQLVADESLLQIVGTVNDYSAIMAEKVGHKALYLSGGGVAACSLGMPDLGISTLHDVLEDAKRITDATSLPLLVDVDTGWGGAFNIARCVREMGRSGVAAIHIEDQVIQKRCEHHPNKMIVSTDKMLERIKSAVDTAVSTLEQYREFSYSINVPILANITEFGETSLFSRDELHQAGVISMALYPLSAFRAMSKASINNVYEHILIDGHQKNVVDNMQTRQELYDFLDYHQYEQKLDQLFAKKGG